MIERIRSLIQQKGTNVRKVEEACGFANGSLSKTNDKTAVARIFALAQFFDVSMEYLVSGVDNSKGFVSNEDAAILDKYHELNEVGCLKVQEYLDDLIESGKYKKEVCLDA